MMSRRDTIILAVLINVGLLVILFATARNTSSGSYEYQPSPIPQLAEMDRGPDNSQEADVSLLPKDEVDQILKRAPKPPSRCVA